MATFTDTIKLVLNLDVDKSASGGLKTLKTDIENTDGAWGKMKVGASGAFDFIKQNAAGFALGAGAAIAGFAVKAVSDFQDVALAAGKFSEATGTTTQDASRFIEVAKDLGIGVEGVEKTIGFMNRTLGQSPKKFADLGVEIARTKDGTVDVTGTFENVADAINRIEDPSKRAAAAQQLLGRGWQQASELIAEGGDKVKAALAGVEGAKVMTPAQVAQARQFRDTMDGLQGVVESLSLSVGNALVPALTELAGKLKWVIDAGGTLKDVYDKLPDPLKKTAQSIFDNINPVTQLQTRIEQLQGAWEALGLTSDDNSAKLATAEEAERSRAAFLAQSAEKQKAWTDDLARATAVAAEHTGAIAVLTNAFGPWSTATKDAERATVDAGDALKDGAAAADRMKDAAKRLDDAWADLTGTLSEEQAFLNIADQFDSIRQKGQAAWDAAKNGAADAEQKGRDYRQSLLDAQEQVVTLGRQIGLSIPETKRLMLLINDGEIDVVEQRLNIMARNRTMNLSIQTSGGTPLADSRLAPQRASGGTVGSNEPFTWVGEQGPELVSLPAGSNVHTANESRQMGGAGGTYNVAIYAQSNRPADIAEALDRLMWLKGASPTTRTR